jgi:hypothetical protein
MRLSVVFDFIPAEKNVNPIGSLLMNQNLCGLPHSISFTMKKLFAILSLLFLAAGSLRRNFG